MYLKRVLPNFIHGGINDKNIIDVSKKSSA